MRLFIAVNLPESWKDTLAKPREAIEWLGRGVKWVEPRGMHLTLKFLGEVEEGLLEEIEAGIDRAAEGIRPFEMRISGTGVFPNRKRPRVYWAGIQAPSPLLVLQSTLEKEMEALGFEPEEREFKPHLTLARIKEPRGKERMTDAVLSFRLDGEPMVVDRVSLMRSHLSSAGARYEELYSRSLDATRNDTTSNSHT